MLTTLSTLDNLEESSSPLSQQSRGKVSISTVIKHSLNKQIENCSPCDKQHWAKTSSSSSSPPPVILTACDTTILIPYTAVPINMSKNGGEPLILPPSEIPSVRNNSSPRSLLPKFISSSCSTTTDNFPYIQNTAAIESTEMNAIEECASSASSGINNCVMGANPQALQKDTVNSTNTMNPIECEHPIEGMDATGIGKPEINSLLRENTLFPKEVDLAVDNSNRLISDNPHGAMNGKEYLRGTEVTEASGGVAMHSNNDTHEGVMETPGLNGQPVSDWCWFPDDSHPPQEDITIVKLLVSHLVAGGIIGRNGQEITSLQQLHRVHIKLSASREFFPGTQDRVVLLSGSRSSVLSALKYIITRVRDEALQDAWENGKTQTTCTNAQMNLKLVVPKASVGILIGKSGSQVKEMQEITGCKIYILKDNYDAMRVKERVCLLWGNEQQVEEATCLIISTIQGERRCELPENVSYNNYTSQYSGSSSGSYQQNSLKLLLSPSMRQRNCGKNIVNLAINLCRRPDVLQFVSTIDIQIPALYAGSIIGSNGRTVSEIQNSTGTNIQMSPKESADVSVGNRKLSISGSLSGILEAYVAIIEKVLWMQNGGARSENSSSSPPEAPSSYGNHGRKGVHGYAPGNKMYSCQMSGGLNNDMAAYQPNPSYPISLSPNLSYYGAAHPRNPYGMNAMVGGGYVGHSESMMMHPAGPTAYEAEYMHNPGVGYWNM
ncbi:hypothetical protein IE077_001997 [Cardiosporidium cionae]|uniref:K Homology domain-containing protein n=1 Tax=Cardiosporidium cionae TaxID=476202 RepID=A0ABQ7JBY0_9APIC|nr:hypothetical protein IE077_001997 [Cardiosporidium cionae]|eukprot:KAF8821464.1 hypothetical protein IE077_001997 [Cardiosporidium cionae]